MKSQKILKAIKEIEQIIDKSHEFGDLQTWDSITNWEINNMVTWDNGVKNILISFDKERARFLTFVPPLTGFQKHWHNCGEVVTILAGELKENGKTYKLNSTILYNVGTVHSPCNPSDKDTAVWLVEFYK